MGAPQIIMIVLIGIGVGSSLAKFGQQKTDRYGLGDVLIGPGITILLLYWGGFWG